MADKIVNKILTKDDIIEIANIFIKERDKKAQEHLQREEEKKIAKEKGGSIDFSYYSCKFRVSITFRNNQTLSRDDEYEWFFESLEENIDKVKQLEMSWYLTEKDIKEYISLSLNERNIYYNTETHDKYNSKLANTIRDKLNSLPPKLDKIIKKKSTYQTIPALAISIPIAVILAVGLFILFKFKVLNPLFENNIGNILIYIAIEIVASLIGMFTLPTGNNALYRKIKLEKKYVGMTSDFKSVYDDDLDDFSSSCEVQIGELAQLFDVRSKIQNNFNRAKKFLWVDVVLVIASIILFFVL